MLSPGAPTLCSCGAASNKATLTSLDSHRPAYCQPLGWFLPKVLRSVSTLPPYLVPSQWRKLVHNLLGSWNQIWSCPGHRVSVLTENMVGVLWPCFVTRWTKENLWWPSVLAPVPHPSCRLSGVACTQGGGLQLLAAQRNCETLCLWTQLQHCSIQYDSFLLWNTRPFTGWL